MLIFVLPMYFIIEDLKKKKKKSKNLVSSRSREPSLVSRLVSWDKCLVTPLVNTVTNRALGILGSLCALANFVFFYVKVTLILRTAHSENDMNVSVGK